MSREEITLINHDGLPMGLRLGVWNHESETLLSYNSAIANLVPTKNGAETPLCALKNE